MPSAMELSLDDELRAVVFAHLRALLDRSGGRIPFTELDRGVTFRGERVPVWNRMKGIFKPEILGREGAALSVHTSWRHPYEDLEDREAGHFVYKYRGSNPDNSDNRALRKAMTLRRPLVYFVAVDPGTYDVVMPVYVTEDDRSALECTLVADQLQALWTQTDATTTEVRRAYATRAVMQRLHQHQFRRIVLTAYHKRCAICRLGHMELLDAAHIISDRDPRGAAAVTNGLGLCKIHHSAYDADILGIDPDARVHVRLDVLHEKDGPMLRWGLQEMHGSRLILPRSEEKRPNRDWLAERFARFRAA